MTTTRTALRVALVAAALIVGADSAAAQTLILQDQGERHQTKISGYGGGETRVGFKSAAMNEIRWSERSDDPCYIEVGGIGIKGGEVFESRRSDATKCEIKWASLKTVTFPPPKPDYRFVRGIQVCTASSKVIKGIRVWPLRLDTETGKLSDDGAQPVAAERKHCKDNWQQKRMCPPDQVGTALILQWDQYRRLTGVKLECSTVRMSTPMTRPK